MTDDRQLNWDGCINVRDLGGIATPNGRATRRGALIRADDPAKLSGAGWNALLAYGVRTIVSLHTDGLTEHVLDAAPRPPHLANIRVAIEDFGDADFVARWVDSDLWCTPLYYRDALERWPERHVAAIAAIARAQPGGVLFHCRRGHDRTGIIALLLLALAGVAPDDIAADYELSRDPRREELVQAAGTTTRAALLATLAWLDVERYLLAGGLSRADLAAVRARLLAP